MGMMGMMMILMMMMNGMVCDGDGKGGLGVRGCGMDMCRCVVW